MRIWHNIESSAHAKEEVRHKNPVSLASSGRISRVSLGAKSVLQRTEAILKRYMADSLTIELELVKTRSVQKQRKKKKPPIEKKPPKQSQKLPAMRGVFVLFEFAPILSFAHFDDKRDFILNNTLHRLLNIPHKHICLVGRDLEHQLVVYL